MSFSQTTAPPSGRKADRKGGPGFLGCLSLLVVTFVAATAGGLFFLSRSTPAETPGPVVLFVDRGTAGLAVPGTLDYKPAATGTVLHPGDMVRADAGSSATLAFSDGSTARLAPEAALILNADWMSAKGALAPVIVDQVQGRILYSVARGLGPDYVILTDAVGYEMGQGAVEVDVEPGGFETVKVLQGQVTTFAGNVARFPGRIPITAGHQRLYDDVAGPLGPIEDLTPNPADPFVYVQLAEAAASAIVSTPGTQHTFSSLEPLHSGQTVTAGEYSTGGGDVTALLSNPGSEARLTITAPGGRVYPAQGAAPVIVRIPAGPPGTYRAEVTGLDVSAGGEPYAVTFEVANACAPAEGNGYLRKIQRAESATQSIKIAKIGDVNVTPITGSGAVVVEGVRRMTGMPIAVTALIYATPPSAQVLLLSLRFQGVRMPTRAVGQASANQVTALDNALKIDRIYACGEGFAIEGPSI